MLPPRSIVIVIVSLVSVVSGNVALSEGGIGYPSSYVPETFLSSVLLRNRLPSGSQPTGLRTSIDETEDFDPSLLTEDNDEGWFEPRDRVQSRIDDILFGDQSAETNNNGLVSDGRQEETRYLSDQLTGDNPPPHQIRDQEHLEHSASLWGHQYVQGGAGEGHQRLKPDGSIPNMQVVKSDSILPAYCNPPNPCPVGYTEADGCIEDFINTAAFSREYQAEQECMCDSEHMFDCPVPGGENDIESDDEAELDTIARSMANAGFNEGAADKFVSKVIGAKNPIPHPEDEHRVVAKKFFTKEDHEEPLTTLKKASRINREKRSGHKKTGQKTRAHQTNKVHHDSKKKPVHHHAVDGTKKETSTRKKLPWMNGEITPRIMAKKSPVYAIV